MLDIGKELTDNGLQGEVSKDRRELQTTDERIFYVTKASQVWLTWTDNEVSGIDRWFLDKIKHREMEKRT